jgi:hypothetical protein
MRQIKTFIGTDGAKLDASVNNWIKDSRVEVVGIQSHLNGRHIVIIVDFKK